MNWYISITLTLLVLHFISTEYLLNICSDIIGATEKEIFSNTCMICSYIIKPYNKQSSDRRTSYNVSMPVATNMVNAKDAVFSKLTNKSELKCVPRLKLILFETQNCIQVQIFGGNNFSIRPPLMQTSKCYFCCRLRVILLFYLFSIFPILFSILAR